LQFLQGSPQNNSPVPLDQEPRFWPPYRGRRLAFPFCRWELSSLVARIAMKIRQRKSFLATGVASSAALLPIHFAKAHDHRILSVHFIGSSPPSVNRTAIGGWLSAPGQSTRAPHTPPEQFPRATCSSACSSSELHHFPLAPARFSFLATPSRRTCMPRSPRPASNQTAPLLKHKTNLRRNAVPRSLSSRSLHSPAR